MLARHTAPIACLILLLAGLGLLGPSLAAPTARADDEAKARTADTPLDRLPDADRKPIERVVEQLFTTLEKGGAAPAFKTVGFAISVDTSDAQSKIDAFIDGPGGGAEDHEIFDVTPIGRLGNAYDIRVISYHRTGLAAWRLRFYLRITDRRWTITELQAETRYPADFLTRSRLEFDAFRAQSKGR